MPKKMTEESCTGLDYECIGQIYDSIQEVAGFWRFIENQLIFPAGQRSKWCQCYKSSVVSYSGRICGPKRMACA